MANFSRFAEKPGNLAVVVAFDPGETRWVPDMDGWHADGMGRVYDETGTERVGYLNNRGYLQTKYHQKPIYLSVIVCTAFHGLRPEGMQCLHRNDIKLDNRPDNLYWGTHSQNMKDQFKNGIKTVTGSANPCSILTEEDVVQIRELYSSGLFTQKRIGSMYGINQQNVSNIVNRRTWSHI